MEAEWDWRSQKEKSKKKNKKFKLRKKEKIMNYGEFGGQYVPQGLMERLNEIEREFKNAKKDKKFKEDYLYY